VDYEILLPGESPLINLGIDTWPAEHSGSSIATAKASGFAGLILCLVRYNLGEKGYSKLGITGITEMQAVFRFLAHHNSSKFPQANELHFLKDKNVRSPKDEKDVVKELNFFLFWKDVK
jgi:hypothetical protein